MKRLSFSSWIRASVYRFNSPSIIWNSIVSALLVILRNLRWLVGCGNNIYIGRDSIVSIYHWHLSEELLHLLHENNVTVLQQACGRVSSVSTK